MASALHGLTYLDSLVHAQATIAGGGVIPHIHKSLISKVGKEGKVSVSPRVPPSCPAHLAVRRLDR